MLFIFVADVVIDEQGYIVPPRISRQQEGTTICDAVFNKYAVSCTCLVRNHYNALYVYGSTLFSLLCFSDTIEDEGDYVHPPTVAGQQEQANVYDVINPTA